MSPISISELSCQRCKTYKYTDLALISNWQYLSLAKHIIWSIHSWMEFSCSLTYAHASTQTLLTLPLSYLLTHSFTHSHSLSHDNSFSFSFSHSLFVSWYLLTHSHALSVVTQMKRRALGHLSNDCYGGKNFVRGINDL